MRQTVRLGRIAGIPIGVHWSVLVIMLLLAQGLAVVVLPGGARGHATVVYWGVAVVVAVAFLAALLAHELAHSLVARHYGVRVRAITLWLLGGVSQLDGEAPHARADLLIALAGPVVSLAGAGVFAAAAAAASFLGGGALAVTGLAWLAVVNVILGVFNLLPGAPLDGGRVLAAVLWWVRGDRAAAHRAAGRAGMVLGGLLIAAGFAEVLLTANFRGLWLVVLGWFLAVAARAETVDGTLRKTLAKVRVGDIMTTPAVCGYTSQSVADFVATVARRHPYRTFPVLDLDGRLVGLVSLTRLARVPSADRPTVRVGDVVSVPVGRTRVLDPATSLVDAAPALLAGGHRVAPVVTGGRLAGIVTHGDVARATELAELGITPDRGDGTETTPGTHIPADPGR
ncbi:site-2 protease family protein [Dactylosporangium sp. AC04546]|uniref:site-2 protease family protein n=1 Tax=Dactylosporangium sp. AC04546 TaxID=2862460 RepID=UPI001EDF7F65|nr:site-2 protease family protein [Dactylosporangium sp. AC04546]WVK88937.1 site-2 protease family protein [Dactylosporangium sp. AC04546]